MRANLGKGLHFEERARDWLTARGLQLLQANYRCRFGEIDLIMCDRETLCFVEVKYRRSSAYGGAAAAISPAKQRKLVRSAQCYLETRRALANHPMRFDAVLIQRDANGTACFNWIRDAFPADV